MFKKKKTVLPAHTFISTPKRLLAILQLCIAFSILIWYIAQPFMGEHYHLRSRMLLYEYVMGTAESINPAVQTKLQRNNERFTDLPKEQREWILNDYHELQAKSSKPFLLKLGDGLHLLLVGIPAFKLAWVIFAIVISILILLKVEGAPTAAWILPLIVLAYGIDNRFNGQTPLSPPDLVLFPEEITLVRDYLNEPLSKDVWEQQNQLQKGWHLYLVKNWTVLPAIKNESQLIEQAEIGEFNFTLGRLKKWHQHIQSDHYRNFNEKTPLIVLWIYGLWNLFFAWRINLKTEDRTHRVEVSI